MVSRKRLKKSNSLKLGLKFIALVTFLLLFSRFGAAAAGSQWRGGGEFSWIEIRGETIRIETLIPEYSKQISWQVPGNTMVKTAFDYGNYQLKNVYALGQIDKRGGLILARTVQDNLGLAVKGWQVGPRTNMSWWDRLRIWWWQNFRREEQVVINLADEAVLEPDTLADGSEVLYPAAAKLSRLVNATTFSQLVANENLTLTLVDASGKTIDTGQVSRVVTNHGLQVVTSAVSQKEPETKTSLKIKNEALEQSHTVSWLKLVFSDAEILVEPGQEYWSDLVLTLGTDYTRLP